MDSKSRRELNNIKIELRSIIRELESISNGVRNDFKGIGSEKCADSIDSVIDKYYYVKNRLENLDTSDVMDWFSED